jgi:hypothetical protein
MSCAFSSEPPFSRKFVMPVARKEWLPIGAAIPAAAARLRVHQRPLSPTLVASMSL